MRAPLNSSLLFKVLFCLIFLISPAIVYAQQAFIGDWYKVNSNWQFTDHAARKVSAPSITGGHFVFKSSFEITQPHNPIVIDFKNSSVLAFFHHYIVDASGEILAEAEGGIQSPIKNTFFMRHGRTFELPVGQYQLITLINSPYFIAQPHPYIDSIENYRQAIKWGTVITLISTGILISLGTYYAILAAVRRRKTELMYTSFIWLNVLFTGTTMLITPDLLNIHWFYLAGAPILLSNFAYLLFSKNLLQIHPHTHPKLNATVSFILVILTLLLVTAFINLNWMLECARYGVGVIMLFALTAALVRAYEGYKIAYFYLIAITAFFIIGSIAITSKDLDGIYTIYIEHIGLAAVATEVLLIGLVLGYQFAEIYREKEQHLALAEHSLKIAHHDALTGLPNRYALDVNLSKLSDKAMLTILDIDNLKHYNDEFGHQKGDEMLQIFAEILSSKLEDSAILHRMGGDEFAITTNSTRLAPKIEYAIFFTIEYMKHNGFDKAGASYGSAYIEEADSIEDFIEIADKRMYRHKRSKSNAIT